jgi:hypothetical protein
MQKKLLTRLKALTPKQRKNILLSVLIILLFVLIVHQLTEPKPSVAAYCKVYKQETIALGHNGGDTYLYSTSIFPNTSGSDASIFIPAFSKLDSVAPKEIEPQVKAMKEVFAKMKNDPTETLSISLNGLPSEMAVTQWTQQHCGS